VIACARVAAAALLGGRAKIGAALLGVLASPAILPVAAAPEVLARVAETRAIAALCDGDLCAFVAGSEAASAAFAEVGDMRSATIQRANQGHVYGALGAYERAEAALREVISSVVHLALPQLLAAAQQNLGNVLLRVGRTAEARALLEASLEGAKAQGDRRLEVGARVYLSLCAREAGDPEAALALLADETEARGMPALHVYALGARSRALLSAGRAAEALEAAERAMTSLAEAGGTIEEGEGLVRLAHVEALLATDRGPDARAAIKEAVRSIDARAARITGDALRASFLDRVPENARILGLAAGFARS
jgi:tetratricopeptide (TPR) repeat protein